MTEAIREKAYFLWEQNGRPNGRSQEFWYKAVSQAFWENPPWADPQFRGDVLFPSGKLIYIDKVGNPPLLVNPDKTATMKPKIEKELAAQGYKDVQVKVDPRNAGYVEIAANKSEFNYSLSFGVSTFSPDEVVDMVRYFDRAFKEKRKSK